MRQWPQSLGHLCQFDRAAVYTEILILNGDRDATNQMRWRSIWWRKQTNKLNTNFVLSASNRSHSCRNILGQVWRRIETYCVRCLTRWRQEKRQRNQQTVTFPCTYSNSRFAVRRKALRVKSMHLPNSKITRRYIVQYLYSHSPVQFD